MSLAGAIKPGVPGKGAVAITTDDRKMGPLLTTLYGIDTHCLKALLLRNAMKVLKERPFYPLEFYAEMDFFRLAANKLVRYGLSSKYTIQLKILTRGDCFLNPKHLYYPIYSYCTHRFTMQHANW